MKYPNILFFRDESYKEIDTFIQENKDKYECSFTISSNPQDAMKLFDPNYHVLVTYGKTAEEYFGRMGLLTDRFRKRWIHYFETVKDIQAFNQGVNYCYINTCMKPRAETRPIVSVFTTCYNTYLKLHRPYNSLKAQTLRDWEWVILDDSPDDTHFEFLRKIAKDDPRIRLYKRAANSGNIGNVKNEAASLCRGKYILELDHDDDILPDCLADAAKVFDENPQVGFVYMDFAILYENGANHSYGDHYGLGYGGYYCQKYNGRWINVASTPNINNYSLSHIVGVPNHPRMWRRTTLLEIGNYSEYLPIVDDQELIYRTAVHTKMARIHKLGYIQYMNEGNSNFSLIRNSEINRIGPHFLVPQAFEMLNINEVMREKGGMEDELPNFNCIPMWKRKNYTYKYCNLLLNLNYEKQFGIIGLNNLISMIDMIKVLYENPKHDFLVLDNTMTKEELCSKLDELNLGRMKCYALADCTEDELKNYFMLVYKSTDDYEIL